MLAQPDYSHVEPISARQRGEAGRIDHEPMSNVRRIRTSTHQNRTGRIGPGTTNRHPRPVIIRNGPTVGMNRSQRAFVEPEVPRLWPKCESERATDR